MNLKESQEIRAVVKQDMKNNLQYRDELDKIQSGLSVQQSIDLLDELEKAIELLENEPGLRGGRPNAWQKKALAFLDKHRSKS